MARYLLDTNEIIDLLRGDEEALAAYERLLAQGDVPCCCAAIAAEVWAGAHSEEQADTRAFFAGLEFLEDDMESSMTSGRLKYALARKGRTISLPDALVAGAALHHGAVLLTENRKDFPISDLKVVTRREFLGTRT